MKIAKVNNDQVVEVNDYRTMFPNVSFPKTGPNDAWMAENNCKWVQVGETIDRSAQKIVQAPAYVDGDVVKTYTVEDLTADEIQAQVDAKANAVRKQRDRLLAETDYLALSDNTLTEAMATYRQALRDITDHANFPDLNAGDMEGNGSDWPIKPE